MNDIGLGFLAANEHTPCHRNLSYGELADRQGANNEGLFCHNGAFAVDTGKFTGRSPNDKYLVKNPESEGEIWWGDINQAMAPEVFDELYEKAVERYKNEVKDVYVFDGFCGAHASSRKKVRFVTEFAWHQHFVRNMFIRPSDEELADFGEPDFTIINCAGLVDDKYKQHGLNSENFTVFNLDKKTAIIGGLLYGGEMKKGIFACMHYWLPKAGILSMHCSANIGEKDDVCLFFGLSGTGKTTLSTDPKRRLIGDDEHGWDDEGIFNFEGGCYAKTANLRREAEPEIYDAIRANALLENVWIDPDTREPDYFNNTITENGRVSYPIEHINNREPSLQGPDPKYIVFLCADAFGILPPVARLDPAQAMYHFVSGYTAKVAGTERGIVEPVPNFSPCYGAAFLTMHPLVYAKLMKEKLEAFPDTKCFLVNSGWSGGKYGAGGERMSIKTTRAALDAIFDGSINDVEFVKDELFEFEVPKEIPGLADQSVCNPRNTWKDKAAFDEEKQALANKFAKNIALYAQGDLEQYRGAGPV